MFVLEDIDRRDSLPRQFIGTSWCLSRDRKCSVLFSSLLVFSPLPSLRPMQLLVRRCTEEKENRTSQSTSTDGIRSVATIPRIDLWPMKCLRTSSTGLSNLSSRSAAVRLLPLCWYQLTIEMEFVSPWTSSSDPWAFVVRTFAPLWSAASDSWLDCFPKV